MAGPVHGEAGVVVGPAHGEAGTGSANGEAGAVGAANGEADTVVGPAHGGSARWGGEPAGVRCLLQFPRP